MEKTQIVLINGKTHYFKGEPGTLTYDEISNLAGINPETEPVIFSDATPMRRAFTMTKPDDIAPRENGAIYRVVPQCQHQSDCPDDHCATGPNQNCRHYQAKA